MKTKYFNIALLFCTIIFLSCNNSKPNYRDELIYFCNATNLFDTAFSSNTVIYLMSPINIDSSYGVTSFLNKHNLNLSDFEWEKASKISSWEDIFPNYKDFSKRTDTLQNLSDKSIHELVMKGTTSYKATCIRSSIPVFSKDYNSCYYFKSILSSSYCFSSHILFKRVNQKWIRIDSPSDASNGHVQNGAFA